MPTMQLKMLLHTNTPEHLRARAQLADLIRAELDRREHGIYRKEEDTEVHHILRFFSYAHLPAPLQEVSKPFHTLANEIANRPTLHYDELEAALRKLLEAKDCAVRAALP